MEIKKIDIVSNTHWDREFRFSFEKTRHNLLVMLDTTLDILESDPDYHSFTMDGHSIMIDDYLEMRPERREQVEKFIRAGRLIIGPYYTLAEEFSISHEALIRNLIFGQRTVAKYGGKYPPVAYTPSSWGQTGQYPQILSSFGIRYMMFYRGISHHEAPAEYIWRAPDGTEVTASRFALYCRYNWYYQVHRAVTRGRVWEKDYKWGEFDEVPFRRADGFVGPSINYDLKSPVANYDNTNLKKAILDMLEEEKGHFTTPVFLGMNGHDISVGFPRESEVIKDAQEIFSSSCPIEIEHTDLEGFWRDAEKHLDREKMTVLTGERRAYLKEGKWTYLFPGTISARTYLKQADFAAYTELCYIAEPLNAIAGNDSTRYLERGWRYLLSNHSHDANGGCAPDSVCKDMEYRYRKTKDIAEIVSEDAMAYIAKNLSPNGQSKDIVQLVIYNTLPYERSAIVPLDIEVPAELGKGINIEGVKLQLIQSEKSSIFVDNIWDVPTILDSYHHRVYAKIDNIPAMGYKVLEIKGSPAKMQKRPGIAENGVLENEYIRAKVNNDGTIDVLYKTTGKLYRGLNYFTSQGEVGNAWKHEAPEFDRKYKSNLSQIYTTESGELSGTIVCEGDFAVPESCAADPSDIYTNVHIRTSYTLDKDAEYIKVRTEVNNTAKDHWLRANFPTDIDTEYSYSDSHFDIVRRDIAIPDSTGWVEQAFGTQPLRTFAAVTDGKDGFAVMPKGLFEYEVFPDSTMALTLIRACRIKLAVSEEKVTELEDEGIQCPGKQVFEYAMHFNKGQINELPNMAAELFTPIKCAVCGRGKGCLPHEQSVLAIDNKNIHVTAVKRADDGNGIIIRYYNPTDEPQTVTINAEGQMYLCMLDETVTEQIANKHIAPERKIITVRLV